MGNSSSTSPNDTDILKTLGRQVHNHLYFGDNLDVLQKHLKDDTIDLVYLDPPFNSHRQYNMLFAEHDGRLSSSQIRAFQDSWEWSDETQRLLNQLTTNGGRTSEVLQAFAQLLPNTDMLAYLVMMAPRLEALRRVLKPTGSIYLHCDPTASHYLKALMDAIFRPANFRAEIIWKRSSAHNDAAQGRQQHGRIHDIILYYTKTDEWTWNQLYTAYDQDYTTQFYKYREEGTGRRYTLGDITGPGGASKGCPQYDVMGVTRYWRFSKNKMAELVKRGRIIQPATGSVPRLKRYLDEMPGVPLQDLWLDIKPIGPHAAERLGYPTQKPELLLERIIKTSSNEGDTILDPFCGCGTAIAVAQRLKRHWIGIDITFLAQEPIERRLRKQLGDKFRTTYHVHGEPTTVDEATKLALTDRFQFQTWAVTKVGARVNDRKTGDQGIDGKKYFLDNPDGPARLMIVSVKSGKVGPTDIRDLKGTMERTRAHIGLLITLQAPTRAMRLEAASAGTYYAPFGNIPRLQIINVEDLLSGAGDTFKLLQWAEGHANATQRRPPAELQPELPFREEKKPPSTGTRKMRAAVAS